MTATEILKSILSFLTDYDTAIGSFIYDLVRPVSEEMAKVYTNNKDTLQKAFALTANGIYLDFKVAEQGITRKQAEYAKGVVTITGTKGAVIRAGSKVASGDLLFSISEDSVLPESGMIDVAAVCDTAGNVGNVATNSISRFPVKLSGLSEVINKEPFSGGSDAETDDELRGRYFEKVSRPNTSGNKYHYEVWAKSVNNVGAVKVIPLANGPGTVKVIVSDRENRPADSALIEEVKSVIEENRPIGARVEVVSSKELNMIISGKIRFIGENTLGEISKSITNYLSKTATEKGVVSYAKIGSIILANENVEDYEDLKINGKTENITISEEYVPILLEVRNETD